MQGLYKFYKCDFKNKVKKNYDHTVVWVKKDMKRLKVSFRAIFNAHFINLVNKQYFSYNVL